MLSRTIPIIILLSIILNMQNESLAHESMQIYENYNKYYSFKYDASKVICYYPDFDEDCIMSEDVIVMYLDNHENVNSWGQYINYFDPSDSIRDLEYEVEHGFLTAQEAAQELKESEDLFFVNRMKACREVPIDGHFKAYYECADGFHAGLRHPKYGYPIYVNYFFQEKPHNLEFFKQILLTFEPLDKSTAPPSIPFDKNAPRLPLCKNLCE